MNLSGLHRKFVLNGRDTLDPTRVTGPTQLLSLGYIWESVPGIDTDGVSTANADQGTQKWIYIEASLAIAAGEVVQRRDTISDYVGHPSDPSAPAQAILGVAQYAIAAGEYGFILREGITETLVLKGAVTDGVPLIVATWPDTGKAEVWTATAAKNASVIGLTIDQLNTVYRINCVG